MLSQLMSIIDKGEGITTEVKKCKDLCPKSAFETVCSFFNRNGGNLLLGVNDDGNITGINKSESKPVFIEGDVFKTITEIKEVEKIHSIIKKEPISADKIIEFF